MKRFLFVGCGSIGRRHIQNLKTLVRCEILAYRVRGEDLGDFGREHGIRVFDDLDRALAEAPDAVFVTNPTSLHLQTAKKAAERGRPLFIEKPLSHSLEGVEEFITLCQSRRLVVLLGYKMRFHPAIRRIKSILESGRLGKVISARAHYGGYLPQWHPWEDYRRTYSASRELGGGVVLDVIHEIDLLYWLLGDVAQVKAFCGKLSSLEIDTEDTAEILLRFRSGALGSVHLDYVQQPEQRSCEIIAEGGTLLWDQRRGSVELYTAAQGRWEAHPMPQDYDANQMFVEELKHFLNCLEGKETPIHTLEDARRVLEIALEARGSSLPLPAAGGDLR